MKIYKKKIHSSKRGIEEIDEIRFILEAERYVKDVSRLLQVLKEGIVVRSPYAFYSTHKKALERI